MSFDVSVLNGYYGVCFDGHISMWSWEPLSAIGMMFLDGMGGITLARVLLGPANGYTPAPQQGSGTYSFGGNLAGAIGTATLNVSGDGWSSTETFRFVVNRDRHEIQFIWTKLEVLDPVTMTTNTIPAVIRGLGQKTTAPTPA